MSWITLSRGDLEKIPHSPNGTKTSECCIDIVCLLVAISQQRIPPSTRHDPAKENRVPDTEVEKSCLNVFELFFGNLIDDDAVVVKKPPPADEEAGKDTIAQTGPPSVCDRCGRRPSR